MLHYVSLLVDPRFQNQSATQSAVGFLKHAIYWTPADCYSCNFINISMTSPVPQSPVFLSRDFRRFIAPTSLGCRCSWLIAILGLWNTSTATCTATLELCGPLGYPWVILWLWDASFFSGFWGIKKMGLLDMMTTWWI